MTLHDLDSAAKATGGSAAMPVEAPVASRGRQNCLAWLASWCGCGGGEDAVTTGVENPLAKVGDWVESPSA